MRARNSLSWMAGLMLALPGFTGAPAAELKPVSAAPAPGAAASGGTVSPWTSEVLRLARAGLDESVLLSYVDAAGTFNPTTEHIISLRDAGASDAVICAILQHDADIKSGVRTVEPSTVSLPHPAMPDSWLAVKAVPAAPPTAAPAETWPTGGVPMITPSEPPLDPSAALDEADPETWVPVEEGLAPVAPDRNPRIREPYAVRLTDPIIMLRAPAKVPNLVLVLGPN